MMKSTYSHISQSIHQVQDSKPNNHKFKQQYKVHVKESNQRQPPPQFIHYYQENINLKNKQTEMSKEIKDLQEKLRIQSNLNKTLNENELRNLAGGKKSAWGTKTSNKSVFGQKRLNSAYKSGQNKNVQHLLEIIDHYKQKMLTADNQLTNLRRQKQLLQQQIQIKQQKANKILNSYSKDNKADEGITEKLKNSIRQLQLQKQRNKYYQSQIKRLQTKIKTSQVKSDDYQQLKIKNRTLEDKLIRMTNLQGFGQSNNNLQDLQNKVKQYQQKLKILNQKYLSIKDNNVKLDAQLKLIKTKLIEVNYQCDSLEKDNQILRQQSVQNPIVIRLLKNPDMLVKVVSQIEKDKYMEQKPNRKMQNYQKILLEKQQLAKQLISCRSKIKALEQSWKEKQRIHKIQKQQMLVSVKDQPKIQKIISNKFGIAYDQDVSMFTQQKINIPADVNYFDLYLGEIHLLETMVRTVINTHSPLVLATVDFYNHNTMHSKLTQGSECDLQSQFSFKVSQDDFFFKYLNKGNFQIDIWISQGNKNHHIGKVNIELKPLITKSRPRVAPVLTTSVPIYLNQKVTGSINLVMRMRLPIYEKVQKLNEISAILSQAGETSELRKLVIHIEQGKGFKDKANTFVYFPFRLQDYYTKTYKGSNPLWNYFKMIQIKYNTDFKNYLRKNDLELTVFDDNAVIVDDKNSDVVGVGLISLVSLLQNKQIKQRIQIRNKNQVTGWIDIKIFWHENQQIKKQSKIDNINPRQKIHTQINKYLQNNKKSAQDIFRFIDSNKTGMISFSQFHLWVINIPPLAKTKLQDINQYYNTFKQPVNLLNFIIRIQERGLPSADIIADFGMINKLLKENSLQIKKKQTLKQFLKGKDILTLSLDIDKDQNGKISKKQFMQYLQANNVEQEIQQNQIYLVQFLKKYQSYS